MTRVAEAISTAPEAGVAAAEAASAVAASLAAVPVGAPAHPASGPRGPVEADLVCVFISPHHRLRDETVLEAVRERLAPRALVGCTGEFVIGGGREVEDGPAVAVWAARLPGAQLQTFHLRVSQAPGGLALEGLPMFPADRLPAAVILLADPFSFPTEAFLRWAERPLGGVPIIGGQASGAMPGQHRLFRDADIHDLGAVGVALWGVEVRTLVSQGCRPIGRSYVVTRAEGPVVYELAGAPALQRFREVAENVSLRDRLLLSQGVLLGVVIDEYREEFGPGDFLIRGIGGFEAESGSMVVGEVIEVGRTVQFHVRDAETADEELRRLLGQLDVTPAGALLFTCNGRGSRLFSVPDHDVAAVRRRFEDLPVAGMFCSGEIGPVGGRSFLHGFTASLAFFV